jgi:hypothetical protein
MRGKILAIVVAAGLLSLQGGIAGTLEITAKETGGKDIPILTVTNGKEKSLYMIVNGSQTSQGLNAPVSITFTGKAKADHGTVNKLRWNFGNNADPNSKDSTNGASIPVTYSSLTTPQVVTCGVDHTSTDSKGKDIQCAMASDVVSKITILPIDVEKVWSDQISGVEVNFFQKTGTPKNGTGRGNKPYILMGARDDRNAYVKLRLSMDIPDELDSQLLWRLALKNNAPQTGSFTFDHSKKEIAIKAQSLEQEGDYQVVVGYDINKDGQLATSEISFRNQWIFKIIPREKYESSLQFLKTGTELQLFPNASRLLSAFANHSTPVDATAIPTQIAARNPLSELTHLVGVLFHSPGDSGASIEANHPASSRIAEAINDSRALEERIFKLFESKREAVLNVMHNLSPTETEHSFTWQLSGGLSFELLKDQDLYASIHSCEFDNLSVNVTVHKSGMTQGPVILNGSIKDIYDFDYDAAYPASHGSRVQSGYNKIGDGGRVYRVRVNLDGLPNSTSFIFY